MDNFEKRMYLNYLIKMMNVLDFHSYNANDVFADLKDNFNINMSAPLAKSRNTEEYKKYIAKYQNLLQNKLSKIKPVRTILEKKIDLVANIYDLSPQEKQLFIYFILNEQNNAFDNLSDMFSRNNYLLNFRKYVLGIKSSNVINEIFNSLYDKGILTRRKYSRDKELNEKIANLFYHPTIKSERKIKNILLGEVNKSELEWSDFDYMDNDRRIVSEIVKSAVENKTKGINILLHGDVGTGKTEFSKLITNYLNIDLYSVTSDQNNSEATRLDRISDLHSKQTLLSKMTNSCILFDEAEDLFNTDRSSKAFVNSLLEENFVPIFWTTNNTYDVDPAILRRMTYAVRFEKHSDEVRLKIWKNILKKNKMKVDENKIIELNNTYDIAPALITNAVKSTKLIKGTQDDFECFIDNVAQIVDKKRCVKKTSKDNITEYNEDLVNADLDVKKLTQRLKDLNKLNFSMCLYGEPGTGKSEYAKHIAKELGLKVVFKRASDIFSKWLGESEKNIARAFEEAREEKAMLIIDEADSFLQSRAGANHRWEFAVVNEMLTQMEGFEYPFVCTTNLMEILDEATLRRFTFKIKFDFLKQEQVKIAFQDFFKTELTDNEAAMKGLTTGDFVTVKKKAEFMEVSNKDELISMLCDEVKVKKSESLKQVVGF